MGATIQRTQFSTETKRILTDEAPKTMAQRSVQVISGIDILTNNQVCPSESRKTRYVQLRHRSGQPLVFHHHCNISRRHRLTVSTSSVIKLPSI